jgi:hypothetical protein
MPKQNNAFFGCLPRFAAPEFDYKPARSPHGANTVWNLAVAPDLVQLAGIEQPKVLFGLIRA